MATESNFNASTDYASVSGVVKDNFAALPNVPPTGLQAIGPRVTFHFVEGEWSSGNSYQYYDVVKYQDASYIAIKNVPAGIDIANTEYWFMWADPNAQVSELEALVNTFSNRIDQAETNANNANAAVASEAQTRADEDTTLSNRITGLEASIGDISTSTPIFVSSTGDMIDTSRIYVLTTNSHVYFYNGSAWTDTGVVYGGENVVYYDRNIYSSAVNVAPYNDFNTVPANTIVLYSIAVNDVANGPEDATRPGLLLTYGVSSTKLQILNVMDGAVYFRSTINNSAGSWVKLNQIDTEDYPQLVQYVKNISSTPSAPYDDFNTMPANSIVLISVGSGISNGPNDSVYNGILLTYGDTSGSYVSQIYTTIDNHIFVRYGGADWGEINNIDINNENYPDVVQYVTNIYSSAVNVAPYNDFNTVPANTIVLYSIAVNDVANGPEDATRPGLLLTYGISSTKLQILNVMDGAVYFRSTINNSAGSWVKLNQIDTVINYGSMSLFETIGVIGDSYASGEIYNSSGASQGDFYNISWPQILARKYGITATNYSRGGLTAKSWLTDSTYGLSKLLQDPAQDLYIIALGINDAYRKLPIGNTSDMTDSPNTNPDTFYGNMDRIVYNVKQHAPKAKIVMAVLASTGSEDYSTAIRNVADHNNVPTLPLDTNDFFQSDYYKNNMYGGHPVAVVYSGMADAYAKMIENCFNTNFSYFADYTG